MKATTIISWLWGIKLIYTYYLHVLVIFELIILHILGSIHGLGIRICLSEIALLYYRIYHQTPVSYLIATCDK